MTNRDDSMEMRTSEQERQWVGAVGGPDDRRHNHDAVGEPQGPEPPTLPLWWAGLGHRRAGVLE